MKHVYIFLIGMLLTGMVVTAQNSNAGGLQVATGSSQTTNEKNLTDGMDGLPPTGLVTVNNNDGTVTVSWETPADMTDFQDYSLYRSEQSGFTPNLINRIADNLADTSYTDAAVVDFHTYYYVVSANFGGGTPEELFSDEAEILVNNASQTTILGYAYLEDRNNHANIKVNFVPQSPSAVADSIYTNALGYFETHDIFPGVYSIRFSKPGFQTPLIFENISIVEDQDLGESMLYDLGTTFSGEVSGTWSGFVSVTGNITVPNGDTLIIEAGTVIRFLDYSSFNVYGYLACNGAEGDSVRITSGPANQQQQADQWQGIDFYNESDDNSYMHHTIVEYAYDGVYSVRSAQTFEHCTFFENSRYGAYLNRSDGSIFTDCSFDNNNNTGLYTEYSSASSSGCDFTDNSSWGIQLYDYCKMVIDDALLENSSSGIRSHDQSDLIIRNSMIRNMANNGIYFNDAYARGEVSECHFENCDYGIYLYYRSSPHINNNTFVQNNSGIHIYYDCDSEISDNVFIANYIGIRFDNSSHYCQPTISHNIIAYQSNDGILKNGYSSSYNSDPVFEYNTIFGNGNDGIQINAIGTDVIKNNIISDNGNFGLNLSQPAEVIENNTIYANAAGEISNLGNAPSETWNFVSVNPNNNASCDIYRNINEDPMFNLSDTLDLTLQTTSKCINGGSEEVADPDGTISDIGALPFDHGNPHRIYATGYGNQSVSLEWEPVSNDSLVDYGVYYKNTEAEADYVLFGTTADTSIDVTGLINNVLYDFTITGNYANYESGYAPKVSERPGVATIDYDPGSFALVVPAGEDSIVDNFSVTNAGSRELNINFPPSSAGGGYAYFDGSGDYISTGHHDYMDGMSALTMEVWIYRQNPGHFGIMGKNYRNYQLSINSQEDVYFYKGYGNSSDQNYQGWDTDQHIDANKWYHLAITWQGDSLKLYVNGELAWQVGNAVSTPIPEELHYAFDIGRRGGENSYYMQGRLSEARVWDIARTGDQIKKYMYQSLSGDEEGLIGYWPMKEDFNDHSSYGLQCTANGETYIESIGRQDFDLYTVPQTSYNIAPGATEVIPLTFYMRNDMTSKFFTTWLSSDDLSEPLIDLEVALQYGETVPATPVHFVPVAETGIPYTIYITDATIDGVTIDVGDEIGVFDGDLCVGAGIYNGGFNFIFTCWQEDPGDGEAGFTPGNNMIFKMYDTSADLETNEADEFYYIGDDTFGYGNFSSLSLKASVYNIQNVAYTGGQFNLVSFNLLPRYPNASDVFADLSGLQIVYNDDGGVLIPGYNINTIGDINFLDGFYLFGDQSSSIAYEGTFIHEEDWEITVDPAKWNYISVLSQDPVAVTDVFAGLETEVSIVQSAGGDSWIPGQGINTLGNMQPGQGYKIALAVDTAVSFSYPPASAKSSPVHPLAENPAEGTRESNYFNPVETGLPYAMVLKIKTANEYINSLLPGDEIGLFDGDLCVGATVYQGESQLMITTWEKDDSQNLPGFTPGNPIHCRIYRAAEDAVTRQRLGPNNGTQPHFADGNYGIAILGSKPISEKQAFYSVSPNPFKYSTEVVLQLAEKDHVKVQVFDRSGRLVKVLENNISNQAYHKLEWDGTDLSGQRLRPGVYVIIAETTTEVFTEKVILLR